MPHRPSSIASRAEHYDLATSSPPAYPYYEREISQRSSHIPSFPNREHIQPAYTQERAQYIPGQFLQRVTAAARNQRIQPQTPSTSSQANSSRATKEHLQARLSFWLWRKDAPKKADREPQNFGGVISHPLNRCFVQSFEHFIKKELLPLLDTDLEQYSPEPGDVYRLALAFTKKPVQPVFLSPKYNKEIHTTKLYELFHKRDGERDINIIIVRKEVEEEPDLRLSQVKQDPGARDARHPSSESVRSSCFSWPDEIIDYPDLATRPARLKSPVDDVDVSDLDDPAIFFKKKDPAPPAGEPTTDIAPAPAPAPARSSAKAPPSRHPKRRRAVSSTVSPPQTRRRVRDRLQGDGEGEVRHKNVISGRS
ncbi:hypothetical protein N7510_005249 [Penicillium lagena]|uniref:uncharacterized protein n=1 Tax=Penicillium lagena TaxID=94218 RepID=UPI00254091A8|nr:uncharacterized protein N7510_005249 [Penicillium lagena]KAJ5612055.1 hypothetical protein N7510_005249 [Penicillium lagena]